VWKISNSPSTRFANHGLKFFGLSDLNVPTQFFRASPSLTRGNPTSLAPTRPPIIRNTNPITPLATSFLYKLEGFWTTNLTKAVSINQLDVGRYLWLNGSTFVISDLTTRTFVSQIDLQITDPINLGFFENEVTKVVVGGLNLDFEQTDGNLVITTDSKSCIGRIGQTAKIWFEKEIDPITYNRNQVVFFSKAGTGIGTVTLFDYLGYNYLISTTLEPFTLVNVLNNRFFIVRETLVYSEASTWLLSGGNWNDDSVWNDEAVWED